MTTTELERLMAEATPLPWLLDSQTGDPETQLFTPGLIRHETEDAYPQIAKCASEADAALIVAAVNALPELLAKVKRLEAALKPFGEFAKAYKTAASYQDDFCFYDYNGTKITLGDLRRARAALSQEAGS